MSVYDHIKDCNGCGEYKHQCACNKVKEETHEEFCTRTARDLTELKDAINKVVYLAKKYDNTMQGRTGKVKSTLLLCLAENLKDNSGKQF